MKDTFSQEQYISRIEYLEENRRYVHEALEKALSVGDFQEDLKKHGSSDQILLQAQQRINQLISFEASALFLVNDDTSDFEMTVCEPSESRNFIQKESDTLIDNGFFGWALRERRGVLIESENHSRQFLLHVVSTHSQMKGMFIGILDGQSQSVPESSRYLLSIILLNTANALESLEFHRLMQEQNILLETKVEERTKELEKNIRGLQEEVSKRKQIEEELKKSKETAEAASTSKGEFLANMSHEIRTPLNGIIGMLEMAMDSDLNDDLRGILNTVNTEAESLLEIINGILDFSKIEAGKLELEEIPFNLSYLLEDLSKGFAFQAEQKGIEFIASMAPDLPHRLIGDPVRLRQILVNLAGNALKFTHKGSITVHAEFLEASGERLKIRFLVKDTGIGIPKDQHEHIFGEFTQADGSTTRVYGGTGLGTSISRQLAIMMGGTIGLNSEEGKGSTFWFTSLFQKQSAQEILDIEQNVDLNGLKVLVAEDNLTSRLLIDNYLRSWGCSYVEADNGKEALSILEDTVSTKQYFDLILTDLLMPEMDGFELIGQIKKIETLKEIPIIILTAFGAKGHGKMCRDMGVEGYLTKPIEYEDLQKAIKLVLGFTVEEKEKTSPNLITRHTLAEKEQEGGRRKSRKAFSDRISAEEEQKEFKVLLAEDYLTNQKVAINHLKRTKCNVDIAENGLLAVNAFKEKQYDIILMDIQMPVMDGFEATSKIRAYEAEIGAKTRVPIIAITAHAIKGYKEQCIEKGMDDYLTKPLKRDKLIAIVEKWAWQISECRALINDFEEKASPVPEANDPEPDDSKITDTESDIDDPYIPIDYKKALAEFDGNEEFLMELVNDLLEEVKPQIETIRQAISDNEHETVMREAHSIKGGAANLAAKDLSGVAFELEKAGKAGISEGNRDLLAKLETEFSRLERFYNEKTEQLGD